MLGGKTVSLNILHIMLLWENDISINQTLYTSTDNTGSENS